MAILDKIQILKNVLLMIDKVLGVVINSVDYILKQKDIS